MHPVRRTVHTRKIEREHLHTCVSCCAICGIFSYMIIITFTISVSCAQRICRCGRLGVQLQNWIFALGAQCCKPSNVSGTTRVHKMCVSMCVSSNSSSRSSSGAFIARMAMMHCIAAGSNEYVKAFARMRRSIACVYAIWNEVRRACGGCIRRDAGAK